MSIKMTFKTIFTFQILLKHSKLDFDGKNDKKHIFPLYFYVAIYV